MNTLHEQTNNLDRNRRRNNDIDYSVSNSRKNLTPTVFRASERNQRVGYGDQISPPQRFLFKSIKILSNTINMLKKKLSIHVK